MGKLLKWVLGLVIGLVVLVIALGLVLPRMMDTEYYKEQLIEAVKRETGRELRIARPLELSVFPWLGVRTGGVELANAPGFGETPMLRVQRLDVRVRLLPLLRRQVEVDTVVLQGAEIDLQRDAQGRANWDDLLATESSSEAAEAREASAGDEGGMALAGLRVAGIELRDVRLSWRDAAAKTHYVLDALRLETGALTPGASVPVEGGFTLVSTRPRLEVRVDLETRARSDAAMRRFELDDLELTVRGTGEGLPKDGLTVRLEAAVAADLEADTLALKELRVEGPEVALAGGLQIEGLSASPRLQGRLVLERTNVKQLAALFGASLQTADPAALTRVGATLELAHDGKATRIEPFEIVLDDTRARGHVRLLDTRGPVLRARLDVDAIDLDRYLPPAGETGDGEEAPAAKAGGEAEGAPFAALRTLDLEADLAIGRLTVRKARLQDVKVRVRSRKGVLEVAPATARLYEGTFDGRVRLDVTGAKPRLHAVKRLENIRIGPLLADVAGEEKLTGTGSVQLDLRTTGLGEADVRRSLTGSGRFSFRDGAYRGIDLVRMIRNALGQRRNATQQASATEQTEFTELGGSFTARNGVIENRDLAAKSPLLRVTGKGRVDLPANRVDYTVTAKLVASLEGQGGAAADQLAGLPIPVRIKGPLDGPGYSLDVEALLSAQAKQRLEQEKAKVRAKVEQKVQEKLKGALGDQLLKGIFGQ